MTLDHAVRLMPAREGRVTLTFDEVFACERPAVFHDFGDLLFYVDGRVFIFSHSRLDGDGDVELEEIDARVLAHGVGVETGWHHSESCDCHVCSESWLDNAS
jgi:hypothetical protein